MNEAVMIAKGCRGEGGGMRKRRKRNDDQSQVSIVAAMVAALRKSMISCRLNRRDEVSSAIERMEIGWPTDVCHVCHVRFDRFHGFLGLPVEFELEIPRKVPSASASVFGVSAESMQCSYDSKGNSVPTILLLMQERLYSQGGLKAEGIFRINPENSQEEHVRDQLNKGIVPEDIDVHCLAGLIKAWFRELPAGVLDGLSPEQVLQCNTEEDSTELVKLLLPTQLALLNWAVDLMADVVEQEEVNKMNARNIAMVFAPNMTQMSDPLTALIHAVQVMNLLKTLILKALRGREETATEGYSPFSSSSPDQADEDDFDSQHEVDMNFDSMEQSSDENDTQYCQHEVDMNFDSMEQSSDENDTQYCHSGDDESCSFNEIEECFIRQLEEGKEVMDGDQKCIKDIDIQNSYSARTCCSDEGRQVSISEMNSRCSLSTSSASKNNCTSTSDTEDSDESVADAEMFDLASKGTHNDRVEESLFRLSPYLLTGLSNENFDLHRK